MAVAASDPPSEPFGRLARLHYLLAAVTAVLALFPVALVVTGAMVLSVEPARFQEPTLARAAGAACAAVGATATLSGWIVAAVLAAAGRALKRRRHWHFCIAAAAFAYAVPPLGPFLGAYTLITLLQPSMKEHFGL